MPIPAPLPEVIASLEERGWQYVLGPGGGPKELGKGAFGTVLLLQGAEGQVWAQVPGPGQSAGARGANGQCPFRLSGTGRSVGFVRSPPLPPP